MKHLAMALTILAMSATISAPAAFAKRGADDGNVRLQCNAEGARDFGMDARYESRRGRSKFDASFEAAANVGINAGQTLGVAVGGVDVGSITLTRDPFNGDIVGDLECDTQLDDSNPFPNNFPVVGSGTSVTVGALGCALN